MEARTRPVDPEVERTHRDRWAELPTAVRTPSQLLGRKFTGCEATHGVFPACNLGCEPCYHGREANRVPVDGAHTIGEVERQMAWLRRHRGPGQYAQLIGGEVTLLPPAAHAEALEVMARHGRIPMSFTHGDVDLEHLERVALRDDGTPRFRSMAFAVHVDSTMRGRRGHRTPSSEAELDEERARIAGMFDRLRRRHGIRTYLAHTMTVTPANVGEVAHVVRVCRRLGYRMLSFQPAARLGDPRRWTDDPHDLTGDEVWAEVERGVGRRLPHGALQVGDPRCNRSTWGVWFDETYVPLFDDQDPDDLRARDAWLHGVPANMRLDPAWVRVVRTARSLAPRPADVAALLAWAARFGRRGLAALAGGGRVGPRIQPTTYVMHQFMAAADVRRAWALMERGEEATDPRLRETQERLRACAYSMAHPEEDRAVPACVQHGVLDPAENRQLLQLLPRPPRGHGVPPG